MGYRYPKLEYLRHWTITAPNGRQIYDQGETPEAFYRVESGCIRLQIHSAEGRRQILGFCLPGDIFGLDFCESRPMAAEAVAASKLARYPLLQDLRGGENSDCSALLAASSQIAGQLTEALMGFGHSSATDRVVWFLNWIAEKQAAQKGGRRVVQLPMSRCDIADYLGLAPETLSRVLGQLVEARRIEKVGRTIVLEAPCSRSRTPVGRLAEWRDPAPLIWPATGVAFQSPD